MDAKKETGPLRKLTVGQLVEILHRYPAQTLVAVVDPAFSDDVYDPEMHLGQVLRSVNGEIKAHYGHRAPPAGWTVVPALIISPKEPPQ